MENACTSECLKNETAVHMQRTCWTKFWLPIAVHYYFQEIKIEQNRKV
jgi:hypothetical protein